MPFWGRSNQIPSVGKKMKWAACVALCIAQLVAVAFSDFRSRYAFGFDAIGLLAFEVVFIGVVGLCFAKRRARRMIAISLVVAYLTTYSVLSHFGGYYFTMSGRWRWNSGSGLASFDQICWHPCGVCWEPYVNIDGGRSFRATTLGWFFSPLILIDRGWIHPSRTLFGMHRAQNSNAASFTASTRGASTRG